jgi:hypothetical protein
MQIEVCRSTYLDEDLREPGQGLAGVATVLADLVRRLADEIGQIGQSTRLAAE